MAYFLRCWRHSADRPNILWLSAEDISPHLGCYGDPHAITPALDQLAAEGVRYTHGIYNGRGVCALPQRHHYRDVSDVIRNAPHALSRRVT